MVQAPLPRLIVIDTVIDAQKQLLEYLQTDFPWASSAEHPDLHWLNEPGETLAIENVRKLQALLAYPPYQADTNVVIIHQIELASIPAQNALLKTLEEPPAYVQIILTTAEVAAVLPTVVSRCMVIHLHQPDPKNATPQHELSPQALASKSYGELIDLAEKYTDRIEAEAFVEAMIESFQQELATKPSAGRVGSLVALNQARVQLGQNLNVRLVLEAVLFRVKQLLQQN